MYTVQYEILIVIKKNSGPLEELIDSYKLIIKYNPDYAICQSSKMLLSIIDLALTSSELRTLFAWEILEEYPSISDHEFILLECKEMKQKSFISAQKNPTRWNIQKLVVDKNLLDEAKMAWIEGCTNRSYILFISLKENLDREIK